MTLPRPDVEVGGPVTALPALLEGGGRAPDPADVLAVTVARAAPGGRAVPDRAAELAADLYGVDLDTVLPAERVSGRAGEVVRVPVRAPEGLPYRLLLVGTGAGRCEDLRRAGAALARAVRGRRHVLTSLGDGAPTGGEDADERVRAMLEGLLLGGYAPPARGTTSREEARPVERVTLLGAPSRRALELGRAHATATWRVRDLTNMPSNTKNPEWVVARARELAEEAGLGIEVWDEHRLQAEGFGGILAVGRGSASPPRFVRLTWGPDGATAAAVGSRRPVVLVGKGITFDTGGLSIKPREAMVPMKTDMAGAAAVLATMAALPAVGVRAPVTGLLALAENAVGAASYRPGDVVRHLGGRTVEVANTDAEGRMVLADALAYADAELDPEVVVDVATLTGAASLGLGRRHAALYSTDDPLAAALEEAARASGERVWRMPLVEDYRPVLDSSVADLRHVPAAGSVGGGSITAALFLREFAGGRPWAHLDVAGPARADKDEHEVTKGASGYGARLLLRWLEARGRDEVGEA